MKVQLERKSATHCPPTLHCTVCGQRFESGAIRNLLYNGHNLLQGDVCPDCMHLSASQFRQKLRDRASLLLKLSELDDDIRPIRRARALELLDTAKEAVHFPAPYQWWWKRLETLSEDTNSSDQDVPSHNPTYSQERLRLDKLLEHDRDLN